MAATHDEDEIVDRVLDEYSADHGVRVDRVSRNGLEERTEFVKVYATREDRYHGLDGETTTNSRQVIVNEMPAGVAYEVLVGLAEAHGYRLVPK